MFLFAFLWYFLNGPGRPPVGKCPFRDGQVEITYTRYPGWGDRNESIQITGKDSLVTSASKGVVLAIFNVGDFQAVMVRSDRFFYTYSSLDTCLVKKGEQVEKGDTLGFCSAPPLEFIINDKDVRVPGDLRKLVDCSCKMVDYQFKVEKPDTSHGGADQSG